MTPRRPLHRLAEWIRRWRSSHSTGTAATPDPAALLRDVETSTLGGPAYGLDDITRLLDRWFDAEVRQLEEEARRQAHEWASAGLPRAGVADEQLPVERILALRATELHRKWSRLLRTKVQDGIAEATRRAGGALLEYREHRAGLRRTERELEQVGAEVARLEATREAQPASAASGRILAPWKFWTLIALLICVDWIANVPVFQELLPKEPGADEMWANVVARSERFPVFGGIYRSLMRVAFSPEVSLLALGVISFLVFLAHMAGDGLRTLLAVNEKELTDATLGIRSHRRQYFVPVVAGGVGALCVVTVLFLAREELRRQTEARLAEAVEEAQQLEVALARARDAGDLGAIGEINARLAQARAVVDDRAQRAEYARGIQGMNVPITILNVVLIIAAAMASYLSASDSLARRRLVSPRLLHLQYELEQLRVREAHHRIGARRAATEVQARLSQAERLLRSRPLRDWNEKAERLRGVIETFRAENARVRGVDPISIAAFRQPIVLDASLAGLDEPFEAPAELAEIAAAFRRLQGEGGLAAPVDRARGPEAQATSPRVGADAEVPTLAPKLQPRVRAAVLPRDGARAADGGSPGDVAPAPPPRNGGGTPPVPSGQNADVGARAGDAAAPPNADRPGGDVPLPIDAPPVDGSSTEGGPA